MPRQEASDALARLASAHDRIRDLEQIASALNLRLIEANERLTRAQTHLASANASADVADVVARPRDRAP